MGVATHDAVNMVLQASLQILANQATILLVLKGDVSPLERAQTITSSFNQTGDLVERLVARIGAKE